MLSPATVPLYEAVRDVVGKPPSAERPYIWNDSDQFLSEHIGLSPTTSRAGGRDRRAARSSELGRRAAMNIAQVARTLARARSRSRRHRLRRARSSPTPSSTRAASRVANALRELGVGRGDRVALFLPNIPAFADRLPRHAEAGRDRGLAQLAAQARRGALHPRRLAAEGGGHHRGAARQRPRRRARGQAGGRDRGRRGDGQRSRPSTRCSSARRIDATRRRRRARRPGGDPLHLGHHRVSRKAPRSRTAT